jgi:RHH-type transcriptional regulator, rel operon repressor / antitoxin RelB
MKQNADKSPTISLRLPPKTIQLLDKAAKATRRSRSFVMKEALDQYLEKVPHGVSGPHNKPLSHLLSLRGIAQKLGQKQRTKEEIDAHIRWLRGND